MQNFIPMSYTAPLGFALQIGFYFCNLEHYLELLLNSECHYKSLDHPFESAIRSINSDTLELRISMS